MVDVIIDGIGNLDPQKDKWPGFQRIKKILAKLPDDIREQCSVIIQDSIRIPMSNKVKARPLISILGEVGDPALIAAATALEELREEYDLRIIDAERLDELQAFATTMQYIEATL